MSLKCDAALVRFRISMWAQYRNIHRDDPLPPTNVFTPTKSHLRQALSPQQVRCDIDTPLIIRHSPHCRPRVIYQLSLSLD